MRRIAPPSNDASPGANSDRPAFWPSCDSPGAPLSFLRPIPATDARPNRRCRKLCRQSLAPAVPPSNIPPPNRRQASPHAAPPRISPKQWATPPPTPKPLSHPQDVGTRRCRASSSRHNRPFFSPHETAIYERFVQFEPAFIFGVPNQLAQGLLEDAGLGPFLKIAVATLVGDAVFMFINVFPACARL